MKFFEILSKNIEATAIEETANRLEAQYGRNDHISKMRKEVDDLRAKADRLSGFDDRPKF